MSLLRRLLRRPAPRRLSGLDALTHARPGELVEVHGRIEAIATIAHPTTGEPCVALEYRAWPQSTTIGIAGASPEGSRAFQLTSRQAADFVLQGAGLRVLVRVEPGEDLIALHHALLADYGIGLRHQIHRLIDGDLAGVVGRLEPAGPLASPMRSEPFVAVLRAHRIWRIDDPPPAASRA